MQIQAHDGVNKVYSKPLSFDWLSFTPRARWKKRKRSCVVFLTEEVAAETNLCVITVFTYFFLASPFDRFNHSTTHLGLPTTEKYTQRYMKSFCVLFWLFFQLAMQCAEKMHWKIGSFIAKLVIKIKRCLKTFLLEFHLQHEQFVPQLNVQILLLRKIGL